MTPRWLCRCVILLLGTICLLSGGDLSAQPRARGAKRTREISVFRRQHAERRAKFVAALEELIGACEAQGLSAAVAEIRRYVDPVDSTELQLEKLPREVQKGIPADLPAEERQWRNKLLHEREEYAKDLYLLERNVVNSGHMGFAFDLVREAAYNNPDYMPARKSLGFVRDGDQWLTVFERRMQQEKRVWHDQFGWIPREHVDRYERGDRFYRNKWISAEKEAVLRQEFDNGWEIITEHYRVRTNHSQERGVELAQKLEDFHGLFFHLMAGFFNSPVQLQQLLSGSPSRPATIAQKNVVHYYRSRAEYVEAVRKETDQPVEITRGIYFPRTGIAHFFYDADADDSTLYHEATHQLLSGSRPGIGEIGIKANFWIIEGIACYMESFHREGGRFAVGDPHHDRIRAARAHFVNDAYYVPFGDFSRMGMAAFQGAPEGKLRKNYSQGAALTHFFMHYDDGRYREALIEHLSQIYSPKKFVRESPESLEDLTGVEAEDLDQQYAGYIRELGNASPREAAGLGE